MMDEKELSIRANVEIDIVRLFLRLMEAYEELRHEKNAHARSPPSEWATAAWEAWWEAKVNKKLLRKIDELELSTRVRKCLEAENIVYIGDLVQKSEDYLLRTPNFYKVSLKEVKEVLAQMGLHLGMEIPHLTGKSPK